MHAPYRVQDRKYNRSEKGVGETVALGVQTCLVRAYNSPALNAVTDAFDARVDACAALFLKTHEKTQGASTGRSDREIVDSPYPTSWLVSRQELQETLNDVYPTSWFSRQELQETLDDEENAEELKQKMEQLKDQLRCETLFQEQLKSPKKKKSVLRKISRESVARLSSDGVEGAETHDPPRSTSDELHALQELQGTLAELKKRLDEEESVEELKQKLEQLKNQLKFETFLQEKIQSPKKKKKSFRASFKTLNPRPSTSDELHALQELQNTLAELAELKEELNEEESVEELKQKRFEHALQELLKEELDEEESVEELMDEEESVEELTDEEESVEELTDEEESVEELKQKLEQLKDQLKQEQLKNPKKKKKSFLRSLSFRRTQTSKT